MKLIPSITALTLLVLLSPSVLANPEANDKPKQKDEAFDSSEFLQRLEIQLDKQQLLFEIGRKKADSTEFQDYHEEASERHRQLEKKLRDLLDNMEIESVAKDDSDDAVTVADLRKVDDAGFETLYLQAIGKNLSSIIVSCQHTLNHADDARVKEIAKVFMYKAKMELHDVNQLQEAAEKEKKEAKE